MTEARMTEAPMTEAAMDGLGTAPDRRHAMWDWVGGRYSVWSAVGLTEALANRLRVRVEQANPLQRLNVRDGAFGSLVLDDVAPLLMLPIGLALRQVA